MGWEAQCGADLRHLLQTLQHLPLDPQQAASNVAPLVTLCTTRFAALPAQAPSPAYPNPSSSDTPLRPRQLHRSLTEGDAQRQQPTQQQQESPRPSPSQPDTGRASASTAAADMTPEDKQGDKMYDVKPTDGLQNGHHSPVLMQDATQQGSTLHPESRRGDEQAGDAASERSDGGPEHDNQSDQLQDDHLHTTSSDVTLSLLDDHPAPDVVQQAADVLHEAADQDIRTDNDGKVDMVATSHASLAGLNTDMSISLKQPESVDANEL